MAMLAEPKRYRKRYNLVPRGKALFEDDERFGTKMLQRMGWSKGKGLGANENGNEDFVRLRYKNDVQGLGFEERDDHWTQHEESFSGLLNSLNGSTGGHKARVGSDDERPTVGLGFSLTDQTQPREKFSRESLEAKSKNSRARVHYKKFTKSKDLTQYSEKDLANIFGKKTIESEKPEMPLSYGVQEEFGAPEVQEIRDVGQDDLTTREKPKSDCVIVSKLSVSDYFKQKMEAMKNKIHDNHSTEHVADENSMLVLEEQNEKPSIKSKRSVLETCINEVSEDAHAKRERSAEVLERNANSTKKHKKKSRRLEEQIDASKCLIEIVDEDQPKKIKKRQNKKTYLEKESLKIAEILIDGPQCSPRVKKNKEKTFETLEAPILGGVKRNRNDEREISMKIVKPKKKKRMEIEHNEILSETRNETLEVTLEKNDEDEKETNDDICLGDDVSVSKKEAQSDQKIVVGNELLSIEQLLAKYNSINVYTLSSYTAEKFRNTDLEQFVGSNMPQIAGYSLIKDLKLNIETRQKDKDNINELWRKASNKYHDAAPKKSYYTYVRQINKARKEKKKLPHLSVKKWKRRNAFQAI